MPINILNSFIENIKQFFDIQPTYFFIVLIAIVILILAIAAYIVISVVDFDKPKKERQEREYIRTVLHEAEEGLFSVKMHILCEKKTRAKTSKSLKLDDGQHQSPQSDVTNKLEMKDEGRKMAEVKEKKTRVLNGKYEVFYDGKEYFYTLKASNGELLITSENYSSKETVLAAIDSVKRNVEVGYISIAEDKRGLFQFYLTAKNHRTLVMSANYPTEKRALAASESFKRFAASSPVVEEIVEVESTKEEITINTKDKRGGKLGVIKTDDGYIYMLKASNGEILIRSDVFKTEERALNALKTFVEATKTGKFYLVKDKRDYYQFKLYSATGRIVEVGETYQNRTQAILSANSVCAFIAMSSPFED